MELKIIKKLAPRLFFRLLGLLLAVSGNVFAQAPAEKEKVYIAVDQMPEFPGGQAAMMKFLSSNFKIPEDAANAGASGTMVVSFVVSSTGVVNEVVLFKELYPSLDKELVRVVSSMPVWKPGTLNGKPVAVRFNVPYRIVMRQKPGKDTVSVAANPPEPSKRKAVSLDEEPKFPGGDSAMWAFMKEQKAHLGQARQYDSTGVLEVSFLVSEEGNVKNVKLEKSLHPAFDQAVMKALANMPAWQPAKLKEKAVPANYSMVYDPGSKEPEMQAMLLFWEKVYVAVEEMPKFQNGDLDLYHYIMKDSAVAQEIYKFNGKDHFDVNFIINLVGEVTHLEITKSLSPGFDRTMVQLLEQMPPWRVGRQNNKEVTVRLGMRLFVMYDKLALRWAGLSNQAPWPEEANKGEEGKKYTSVKKLPNAPSLQEVLQEQKVYIGVEQMPSFTGGREALIRFIEKGPGIAKALRNFDGKGSVELKFVINEQGEVSNLQMEKGVHPPLDQLILDRLKQMPAWKPGVLHGKNVAVSIKLQLLVEEGFLE